jgi:hypothetical protein
MLLDFSRLIGSKSITITIYVLREVIVLLLEQVAADAPFAMQNLSAGVDGCVDWTPLPANSSQGVHVAHPSY